MSKLLDGKVAVITAPDAASDVDSPSVLQHKAPRSSVPPVHNHSSTRRSARSGMSAVMPSPSPAMSPEHPTCKTFSPRLALASVRPISSSPMPAATSTVYPSKKAMLAIGNTPCASI